MQSRRANILEYIFAFTAGTFFGSFFGLVLLPIGLILYLRETLFTGGFLDFTLFLPSYYGSEVALQLGVVISREVLFGGIVDFISKYILIFYYAVLFGTVGLVYVFLMSRARKKAVLLRRSTPSSSKKTFLLLMSVVAVFIVQGALFYSVLSVTAFLVSERHEGNWESMNTFSALISEAEEERDPDTCEEIADNTSRDGLLLSKYCSLIG